MWWRPIKAAVDPVLKRQMVQDFYSAGGARGKGLEVACKQSIVTKDLNRAQAWVWMGHCPRRKKEEDDEDEPEEEIEK